MDQQRHDELYETLVRLCQEYGFTSTTTYKLLHAAVHSIALDDEAPRERTYVTLRWTEADLRDTWAKQNDTEPADMPAEVLDGMRRAARKIEDRIAELGGEVIVDYLVGTPWAY